MTASIISVGEGGPDGRQSCASLWGAGGLLVACVLAAVWPELLDGRFGILDCGIWYHTVQQFDIGNPDTYLFMRSFAGRARPGVYLISMPAWFATSAVFHYWFQTGLLAAALLMLFVLSARITGAVWFAAVGCGAALCQPAFTENFYTIPKSEVFVLLGTTMLTLLSWAYLKGVGHARGWWWRSGAALAALAGTVLVYTVKETGGAFLPVYVAMTVVLSWGLNLTWREAIRRTWWLSLCNLAGFCIIVGFLMQIRSVYHVPDGGKFSTSPSSIVQGMARIGCYALKIAPCLVPAVALTAFMLAFLRRYASKAQKELLRKPIAWSIVCLLVAAGMAAPLTGWSEIVAHYFLVSGTFALLFTILACASAWRVSQWCGSRVLRCIVRLVAGVAAVLVLLHSTYSVMVGHLSEGRTRHAFDVAYDEMFKYAALHTESNGTFYAMIDTCWPEPQYNAEYGMRLFYHRPDVTCVFPEGSADIATPGLLAVSEYNVPINYDRMPLQHEWSGTFDRITKDSVTLTQVFSTVRETPIWYAERKYHGPQYASGFGCPAFWGLKRGMYRFGWNVYRVAMSNGLQEFSEVIPRSAEDRIRNGTFTEGLSGWSFWELARGNTNWVRCVKGIGGKNKAAVWLENPGGVLAGVQQIVPVVSGTVYRLSGSARCVASLSAKGTFGARIGFFLPLVKEQSIVWQSDWEARRWKEKSVVFTNVVTGNAVVFAHLGYGKVATSGEFTNIRLERVSAIVRTTLSGRIFGHTSVWDAVRQAGNGDQILVASGTYHEALCFTGHPLNAGLDGLRVIGIDKPVISVELTDVPTVNECAAELSCMRHLLLSNVVIKAVCNANNLLRVYNTLLNTCTNVVVIDCAFVSDVRGTNNIFKTFVATLGATGILVRASAIVTLDTTGSNSVYHTATHDAEPTVFDRVRFIGTRLANLDVGKVILKSCQANQMFPRFRTVLAAMGSNDIAAVLRATDTAAIAVPVSPRDQPAPAVNLVINGTFDAELRGWTRWGDRACGTGGLHIVHARDLATANRALRIENAAAKLIGVQQQVAVLSGTVYRLSGMARSVATNASDVLFGGRVAFFLPPQAEHQIVWNGEHREWLSRSIVFTNMVSGTAIVYVHLGYGNIASTGEFTDIRVEHGDRSE